MSSSVNKYGFNRSLLITAAAVASVAMCAAVGFASEGGEGAHHVDTAKQMKDFMWRVVDFAALMGIVVWALKKANVKGSLSDRQAGIAQALNEASEAKAAADKKFQEYSTKLEAANREIDEIQAAVKGEAESEKARIIAEAHAFAAKIREQATQTASQEVVRAKAELRAEAARLAVQLAEQSLKDQIRKEDQDRLVGEYLTKVVELH